MEKKNRLWISIVVIATLLISSFATILLSSPEASALKANYQDGSSAPPTAIPGVTFTGKYIQIGLNKGGTFGWGNRTDPGTGFQFPIGPQHESLAIYWWGEGYVFFYKVQDASGQWVDNVAYWWPELGWPIPAACNLKYVNSAVRRDDHQGAIFVATLRTLDDLLEFRFRFWFPKEQKYVIMDTVVTNIGKRTVRDILYKRIVDWDIHQDTYNLWTSDSHSAYAHYLNQSLGMNIEMSVTGYGTPLFGPSNLPAYTDLYAWDDATLTPPMRDPGRYDVQSHEDSLSFDGAAAIYFDMGQLGPTHNKKVALVYQAGWYDPGWVLPEG